MIIYKIVGELEVLTGLHIGAGDSMVGIGAIDHPVVKDVLTNFPIIPGSSLKGKLRSLLTRHLQGEGIDFKDELPVTKRLFGSMKGTGRLIFPDLELVNFDELMAQGAESVTEAKFENFIDRMTAVANPRQIERVIRGTKFGLEIIYKLDEKNYDLKECKEDLEHLLYAINLLKYDYLGGHGTRGSGRVQFINIGIESLGEDGLDDDELKQIVQKYQS
ncbi:MAG: type III-A CRISPR-associated RAMP protein Csm3 [Fastidiosipilaceae bacterium]|jgi:CRISPR-associated protein Csm3|nr:type III-A CRISPR-associated RAMP protein Csm3 [Clostridiaceae bacterium]